MTIKGFLNNEKMYLGVSQVALVVKNLPANAGDVRDVDSILGWEYLLEEGKVTLSSVLAWRIPWMEEPGSLQSIGLQRVGHNLACTHILRTDQGKSLL